MNMIGYEVMSSEGSILMLGVNLKVSILESIFRIQCFVTAVFGGLSRAWIIFRGELLDVWSLSCFVIALTAVYTCYSSTVVVSAVRYWYCCKSSILYLGTCERLQNLLLIDYQVPPCTEM